MSYTFINLAIEIIKSENTIYRFDDFEQICTLLTATSFPNDLHSTLYKYKNSFFIVTKPSKQLHLIISEFSEVIKDSIAVEGILQEHGTKIIEKEAFNKIAKSFN